MEKIKKVLKTAEKANDPRFKDYWRNLACWLEKRHGLIYGQSLVEEYDKKIKNRKNLH
jgi:predicted transglutaminase-like protease